MKNYSSARRNLCIFIVLSLLILVGATSLILVGVTSVSPESNLPAAFAATLFVTGFTCVVVTGRVYYELSLIPNGLPRPEDELPRRKLFRVHSRTGNRLTLWNVPTDSDEKPLYWEFGNLPLEVEPEKQIVYLDDFANEYLAAWKENGVIPLLSAKARAKTRAKILEHQKEQMAYAKATNI